MQLKKIVNHGNIRWRVTTRLNGKRKQRFFESREGARGWIKLLNADDASGGFWGQRTVAERDEIISAFNASRERQVPLLEASLDWQPLVPAKSASVREAVALYLGLLAASSFRSASLKQIKSNLKQLASELDCTPCREVTSTMMEEWFMKRNWKRSTIDGVIAKVGPFFSWCVREGYSEVNPCKAVKRPRADKEPPAIFTPYEAKKLLEEAYRTDNGLVPFLAIGLFAGVRPMEIMRLKWKNISGQYIEVYAAKSKTRQRRLVAVLPNLSLWLKKGGDLPVRNKRKRLKYLVAKCGLKWQQDIMRHSFASYHLAMFRSAEKTALELGHRDTTMLFSHYRELVQIADAEEYWSIKPPT